MRDLPLRDYRPVARLRTKVTEVPKARHPVVDAHAHLGRWLTEDWSVPDVGALIALMERCGVASIANLDGMWGEELEANLERYDRARPGRFATFCQPDWSVVTEAGFGEKLAAGLRESVARGARGVKVWKALGLRLRDAEGRLVMPDDERLAPLWETAADRGVPVLIHVADPVAFFDPLDARNERLEELGANPDWWFGDREAFPAFDRIIDSFEAVIAANPETTFVGAHVACYAEDLGWVSRMLDSYPNLHADIAARIAELGRQPRAARELLLRHADRILFGTDLEPEAATYEIHFRFLQTDDEHFAYSTDDPPPQGRWTISGLDLPGEVLERIYGANARRLIGGLG